MVKEIRFFDVRASFQEHTHISLCFFKRYANGDFIILLLYVDDMLIIGYNPKKIVALMKALIKSFSMKDLGSVK